MKQSEHAEDIGHYWQTSRSSPDTWIERARREITRIGGQVLMEAFGSEPATGRAAYVLGFQIGQDRYKLVWPVLPSRTGNDRAARIQAATMLYHDVKARCISAKVLGTRTAFFSFLLLPDGRTAGDVAAPELARMTPALFRAGEQPLLGEGGGGR